MCNVGVRLRIPDGADYADGVSVTRGAHGTVIGHSGAAAVVSVDERPTEVILVDDNRVRPLRGTAARPIIVMPDGKVHPLGRSWPRARTRR